MASHYNNVGYTARLTSTFELHPVTEEKQGTFPSFSVGWRYSQ